MTQSQQLLELLQANDAIKRTSFVVDETPLEFFEPEDSLEFHASRLLFLLRYCSVDKFDEGMTGIKGRTKLAKLDFFLRYPMYLEQALRAPEFEALRLGFHLEERERHSIEAKMIRYKYGPWDSKYYDVFAYLLAKGLIVIKIKDGVDYFIITESGSDAVEKLLQHGPYTELTDRCQIIKRTLARFQGTWLKNFIYRRFPQIVGQPLGRSIEGVFYA